MILAANFKKALIFAIRDVNSPEGLNFVLSHAKNVKFGETSCEENALEFFSSIYNELSNRCPENTVTLNILCEFINSLSIHHTLQFTSEINAEIFDQSEYLPSQKRSKLEELLRD